jgi:hypothetical protein
MRKQTMNTKIKKTALLLPLLLAACASVPNGPSRMALPGSGKDFDQFRADDASCRQFAHEQIGGQTANQSAGDSFARSAALGTAIGAMAGAAAGGGHGAGVGAAAGLAVGSMAGANAANYSSGEAQHRYDEAYIQCMYAQGHRVPVSGRFESRQMRQSAPSSYTPPPPPPPGYGVPPDYR